MEGASDRPQPESAPRRLSTKVIALIIVVILIVAAVAAVVLLSGGSKALTVAVTADKTTATVNETLNFNASGTGGGTVTNYTWNFGDGTTTDTTSSATTHAYQFPGNYLVVVSAKDSQGTAGANWGSPLAISVQAAAEANPSNNSAPLANAGSSADVIKSGTAVTFNANASAAWSNETTPDGNVSNYSLALDKSFVDNFTWDFGDGSAQVAGNPSVAANVTHSYTGDGKVYAANVMVTSIHNTTQKYYNTIVVQPANTQTAAGYIKHPDTMVEEAPGQPQYLDPAVDYETAGGEILINTYETLVWYDGESAVNLKPMIATQVPTVANGGISSDGLNYTFVIKKDVRFHSGNLVTPEDVRYSIERVLRINDPNGPAWMLGQVLIKNYSSWSPTGNLTDIQNAVTVDATNNSVTFHLQYPYPGFIYVMAYTVASVVEKAVVEAHGGIVDEQFGGNPWLNQHDAGTGPYKLAAWVQSQYIQLEAFDQYWQGAPKIKHVYINEVNDVGTREMHLFSGDADIVYIDRNHKTDVQNKGGLTIIQGKPTFNIDFIGMNEDIKSSDLNIGDIPASFFSDIHVRRAFAAAFNYGGFINETMYGTAIQPNGPIPQGMVYYNASVPKYQYDITTVQNEMKQALDTRTADPTDTYFDNGFKLTVFYNTGNAVRQAAVERLAAGLTAALGSKVTISAEGLEWGTAYLPAQQHGQLTCFMLGWAPDYSDPDDYVTPFLNGETGTYAPYIGLNNASLNENITAAAQELNDTARGQLYDTISMDCYNNVYYVWTDQATQFHVQRDYVKGWIWNPMWGVDGQYFFDLSKG